MTNIWFTSDEHYNHEKILEYENRPFGSIGEMNLEIINRFNSKVGDNDIIYHLGDFAFQYKDCTSIETITKSLRGREHVFIRGSHDRWYKNRCFKSGRQIQPFDILDLKKHPLAEFGETLPTRIILCHYALRSWASSCYNSWNLHGHSHGHMAPIGKQLDVGVDNFDFYPVSLEQVTKIMSMRPDNPGFVGNREVEDNISGEFHV
jgi:calcineurin-like phosphoesterase family protein